MPKIRADISHKNPFYLPKHRFLEIYHYCLQYRDWLNEYKSLTGVRAIRYSNMPKAKDISDQTARIAERRAVLKKKMEEIEQAAVEADPAIAKWILEAVTKENKSYEELRGIPCGRRYFYERRRKFYYILSKKING